MIKRKIKVMVMISNMNSGGAQKVVLNNMIQFQNDDQIELKLFAYESPQDSIYDDEIKKNNYDVVYLSKPRIKYHVPLISPIMNLINSNKEWLKAIEKYKPDIIHVHVTEIFRKCLFAVVISKTPVRFATLHSNPYRYKGLSLIFAKSAFNIFGFKPICLTEAQAKMGMDHYGFKKYTILHNGMDFELIRKNMIEKNEARKIFDVENNDYLVVAVGRLVPIKNYSLLLKVFKNIVNKNEKAKLLIAGDGEEKESIISLAEKLDILEKIVLLGNIKNVVQLYCAADVLCMTSISEASPLTLLEAQCCKLRCVISAGVPEENVIDNNVYQMDQDASPELWAEVILNSGMSNVKPHNRELDFDKNHTLELQKQLYIDNRMDVLANE